MSDGSNPEPSNDEFRIAFNGLRDQARCHNVDPNDPNVAAFILHTAEVQSTMAAITREAFNIVHLR